MTDEANNIATNFSLCDSMCSTVEKWLLLSQLLVRNLDETTRSVYKENVRIGEALQIHMQEEKKLKKLREKLEEQNQVLSDEKEMNDMVIKEKVSETKQQKRLIKEVRGNLLISMAYCRCQKCEWANMHMYVIYTSRISSWI